MDALSRQLAEQRERSAQRMGPEGVARTERLLAGLEAAGLRTAALGVGDTAPDFDLPNATGGRVRLADVLARGPVVLSFYRGGWCPYCNIELKALQEKLPDLADLGAALLAVSPELPDESMTTAQKNELKFDVLSDAGNALARQFGLVFALPEEMRANYDERGLDLPRRNGDRTFELPVPATYVIGTDRRIWFAHVDVDYRSRAEPADVVAAVPRR